MIEKLLVEFLVWGSIGAILGLNAFKGIEYLWKRRHKEKMSRKGMI